MKRKIVSQVVAVIGILALVVTVAQAGSGNGVGATNTLWFECQNLVGGTNVGDNVSIMALDGTTILEPNAIVGVGALSCRQVQVTVKGQGLLGALPGDHLKCYSLAVQGKPTASNFTFTDAFGTEPNRTVLGSRYLCATAGISLQ